MEPTKTLAEQYSYTVYAKTPAGHRFAVASYPTRKAARWGQARHESQHPLDVVTLEPADDASVEGR